MSLLDTTQLTLEAAMRGSMMRQAALSNNLANVDTPDYEQQDVDFQSELKNALATGQSPSSVQFQTVSEPGTASADGNGVSSEQVSADIAENGLLYQDLSQIAATRDQILTTAIGSGS